MAISYVLSMDPGIRGCGCAVWCGPHLMKAAYIANTVDKGNDVRAVVHMAKQVEEFAGRIDGFICESPQVYNESASKKNDNDILPLVGVDGAVAAFLYAKGTRHFSQYSPRDWKGQVPKDIMCKRIEARLSQDELDSITMPCASLQHNVWDGIGIGLKFLGRL